MLALGVTPRTVGMSGNSRRPLPQNRRARQHLATANSIQATSGMEVSRVIEFVNQTDPFCSLLGDSITVDLDHHSSSSIGCLATTRDVAEEERKNSTSALTAYNLVGVRLSLVGLGLPSRASLSSCQSSSKSSIDRDELHSNLYSSVLETVRVQLIECIPQIKEEMISKAIINAFADSNKAPYTDGSGRGQIDKYQVEVDYLWKAVQLRDSWSHPTAQPLKPRVFLQELLDDTFLQIRREVLTSPNQVLRAVLAFLSILQMETDNIYLRRDTVILRGLPSTTTRRSLKRHLSQFGEVVAVAMASHDASFAYCRFRNEASALSALEQTHGSWSIEGTTPVMTMIQEYHPPSRTPSASELVDLTNPTDVDQGTPVPYSDADQVSPVCVSKHLSGAYWTFDAPTLTGERIRCVLPD
jgi:RNA recognition motif. (a.k.a. RRM, RBD, or RNP domain)